MVNKILRCSTHPSQCYLHMSIYTCYTCMTGCAYTIGILLVHTETVFIVLQQKKEYHPYRIFHLGTRSDIGVE